MLTSMQCYFDRQNVVLDETPAFLSGSKVIVTFLQESA